MNDRWTDTLEHWILAAYEGRSDPPDPPRYCCTFEAEASGETVWIQVLPGSVNMRYPFDTDPIECLRRYGVSSPSELEIVDWEANVYAAFDVGSAPPGTVAGFVAELFERLLACDASSGDLRASTEELET